MVLQEQVYDAGITQAQQPIIDQQRPARMFGEALKNPTGPACPAWSVINPTPEADARLPKLDIWQDNLKPRDEDIPPELCQGFGVPLNSKMFKEQKLPREEESPEEKARLQVSREIVDSAIKELKAIREGREKETNPAKQTAGKLDLTTVSPYMIEAVAKAREYGIKKYKERENWRKVDKEEYYKAIHRHLNQISKGETFDGESGLPHTWHIACNINFIIEMEW